MSADKIIARAPVNKTAAVVTGKGEHYEPGKRIACADSDLPFPTKRVPQQAEDITGHRCGSFTVIGFSRHYKGRWVVRCVCGRYAIRTRKALFNPANNIDCCELCRHLRHVKDSERWRRENRSRSEKDPGTQPGQTWHGDAGGGDGNTPPEPGSKVSASALGTAGRTG